MKHDIAMKWVEALRSGKYKQGNSMLKNERGEYCCLGVLCEVVGEPVSGLKAYPPIKVLRLSGLRCERGTIEHTSLSCLNDGGYGAYFTRYSFDEIADIIQICWEEL